MEKIATRGAYGEELVALAEQYPELVVIDADEKRGVARAEESAGRRQLCDAKSLAHEVANQAGRILVLNNRYNQFHNSLSLPLEFTLLLYTTFIQDASLLFPMQTNQRPKSGKSAGHRRSKARPGNFTHRKETGGAHCTPGMRSKWEISPLGRKQEKRRPRPSKAPRLKSTIEPRRFAGNPPPPRAGRRTDAADLHITLLRRSGPSPPTWPPCRPPA